MGRSILSKLSKQTLLPVEQLIINEAISKAYRLRRRLGAPYNDEVHARPAPLDEADTEDVEQHVNRIISYMRALLDQPTHRKVFDALIADAFDGRTRTADEVALDSGSSKRTVERIRKQCREYWFALVERSGRDVENLLGGAAA